jgi:hypothetical protein
MEGLAILTGLLVRLGLPLAVTALLVWALRKLDARWQREARMAYTSQMESALALPCWEVNHCPPERRAVCPALAHPEIPCWQHFRDRQGHLKEACLTCTVFRSAPAPAMA